MAITYRFLYLRSRFNNNNDLQIENRASGTSTSASEQLSATTLFHALTRPCALLCWHWLVAGTEHNRTRDLFVECITRRAWAAVSCHLSLPIKVNANESSNEREHLHWPCAALQSMSVNCRIARSHEYSWRTSDVQGDGGERFVFSNKASSEFSGAKVQLDLDRNELNHHQRQCPIYRH